MMRLEIQQTQDGSHTLYWPEKNEHYHSVHGSIQEARKVYVETALMPAIEACKAGNIEVVRVFEMGFGTALNASLTLLHARETGLKIEYTAIEAFPLPPEIWQRLNYPGLLGMEQDLFERMHRQGFDAALHEITPCFSLAKIQGEIQSALLPSKCFHAIYYDAFAPSVQPELWEKEIFVKLAGSGSNSCFLSSYCAQGQFRRNLQAAGFTTERLPGPEGKREITRARLFS